MTGKRIHLKAAAKTTEAVPIKLARLLERAATGRQRKSDATVAVLLDRHMAIAELDLSTGESYEDYIRRTIPPRSARWSCASCAGRPWTPSTPDCGAAVIWPTPAGRSPSIATEDSAVAPAGYLARCCRGGHRRRP